MHTACRRLRQQGGNHVVHAPAVFHASPACFGKLSPERGIAEQPLDGIRQSRRIPRRHHDPGAAVQEFRNPTRVRGDDRYAVRHGFDDADGNALVEGRQHDHIDLAAAVERDHIVMAEHPEKRYLFAQARLVHEGLKRVAYFAVPGKLQADHGTAFAQQANRFDQVLMAFPFVQIGDAKQQRRVGQGGAELDLLRHVRTQVQHDDIAVEGAAAERERAVATPSWAMKRKKAARRIFMASRLLAAMSPRWAVQLQGIPLTWLATMAIVLVTVAH